MIIFFIDLLLFIPFPFNAFSAFTFKLSIAKFAFSLSVSFIGLPTNVSLAILTTLPKAS